MTFVAVIYRMPTMCYTVWKEYLCTYARLGFSEQILVELE